MGREVFRDHFLPTERTGHGLGSLLVPRTQTFPWQVTTAAADQLGLTFVVNISHVGLQARGGAEGLLTETTGDQDIGMF